MRVLHRARTPVRLGDGAFVAGRLTEPAMRRAAQALRRYAATMRRIGVNRVEAVATSAVRDATNGRAFVQRIRTQLGVPLRIISGRTEARLIYRGVVQAQRARRSTLVISIGGGSAQVMLGDGARLRYATSVPLGCARLAQRFIQHDPPRPEEVAALEHAARRAWAPVIRRIRRHRWQQVLGSSETIQQVLAAAKHLSRGSQAKAHVSITQRSLRRIIGRLSTSTAAQRRRMPGLDRQRQDLALPTAVALMILMECCGISAIRYAPGSLREGIILDKFLV